MVPNQHKVTKDKKDKNKKSAEELATAEYLLIAESLKGNFSCKELRGKVEQFIQREDGNIVRETKWTTLGIRLYIDGYMFDIPIGITDYLRKSMDYNYVPFYTDFDGGSKQISVKEFPKTKNSENTHYISSLEKFGYQGKAYFSDQSFTFDGSVYLIDCYHGKYKFNIEQYTIIITKAEPFSRPLLSQEQLQLEQEFLNLTNRGILDTLGNTPHQEEPVENIEIQNPSDILNFSLASCPALALAKIQNIDHILDFVGSDSKFNFSDLELIRPIYDELQDLKSMFTALLLALKAQSVEAQQPVSDNEDSELQIVNKQKYTYTIPPSATTKSGQLKKTQVYIYDYDTNAFMVKALTLYEEYNKTLSEEKAGEKTLDVLKSKYTFLYHYFMEKNRLHKKDNEYKISWFTIREWYKTHFEIKDGLAVKKEKKKD